MKKTNLLKGLVVGVLSMMLVLNIATFVFADDNTSLGDDWDNIEAINTNSGSENNVSANENTDTDTNTNNNSNIQTNTGSATTQLLNEDNSNDEDEENENVDDIPYTGVEDNSVLAIVIVLGTIVAIYSFKKVKEYNSL